MKYLPRKKGNLTFTSCMWIMTMNQHEGTYSAATRVTYRCKIAWLYFRLDHGSNLTGSRIFLIYFNHYFLYCVRPLYTRSSRLPLTVQGWNGSQYTLKYTWHARHRRKARPPEQPLALKMNSAIKCCLGNTKAIAQRWKQTPSGFFS